MNKNDSDFIYCFIIIRVNIYSNIRANVKKILNFFIKIGINDIT